MNLQKFTIKAMRQHTSKLELSRILEISTKTLYEYHDIAMLIQDFESDYPSFTNNSPAITKVALSQYQCWVIYSLILICRRLPRDGVKICLLQNSNPDFTAKFNKKTFNYYLEINNGVERICNLSQYVAS